MASPNPLEDFRFEYPAVPSVVAPPRPFTDPVTGVGVGQRIREFAAKRRAERELARAEQAAAALEEARDRAAAQRGRYINERDSQPVPAATNIPTGPTRLEMVDNEGRAIPNSTAATPQQTSLAEAARRESQSALQRTADSTLRPKPDPVRSARAAEMLDPERAAAAGTEAAEAQGAAADREQKSRDSMRDEEAIIQQNAAAARRRQDMARHNAAYRVWQEKRRPLLEAHAANPGNALLKKRLDEHDSMMPKPPSWDTAVDPDGREAAEIPEAGGEPVLDTLNRLDEDSQEKLLLMESRVPDSLDGSFAHLPPKERLLAMKALADRYVIKRDLSGQKYLTTEDGPTVTLPEGDTRGYGAGNSGRPGGSTIGGKRAEGAPSAPYYGERGDPRDKPVFSNWGSEGLGPRAAPSPDQTAGIVGDIDLDSKAPLTRNQEDRLLFWADGAGLDLDKFALKNPDGTENPRGRGLALDAAKAMLGRHYDMTKGRVDPISGQRGGLKYDVVRSDDPNAPYKYQTSQQDQVRIAREQKTQRAMYFIGNHPIPDTLRNVGPNGEKIGDVQEGEMHPLHAAMLKAIEDGKTDEYNKIVRLIRGHTTVGKIAEDKARRAHQRQSAMMRDPRTAPSMFSQDIKAAGTDPAEQAAAMLRWDRPDDANDIMRTKAGADVALEEARARIAEANSDKEPPAPNKIQAIEQMMAPHAADAMANQGLAPLAEAVRIGQEGGLTAHEAVRVFARQFMRQPGATAAHPVMQEAMKREWDATSLVATNTPADQFLERCRVHLGIGEADAMNWLKANHPHRIPGGAGQQPGSDPSDHGVGGP